MIRGKVERNAEGGLEPWLTISVEDASGSMHQIDVILDTGFTGWLMLPTNVIDQLGLTRQGNHLSVLASGVSDRFDYYETRVEWHERLRSVEILETIDQFLLGTELLQGSRVIVDAWEGGDVLVDEVSPELSA